MCVAIYKPADKRLQEADIRYMWIHNPDGGGFAATNGGKALEIYRALKLDEFLEQYERRKINERQAIIHFRIGTSGKKNEENCHPFVVPGGAICHNGVIYGLGDKEWSDTALLAALMRTYPVRWQRIEFLVRTLSVVVGASRVACLFDSGTRLIFNEDRGVWDGGIWYSNTSYKPYPAYAQGRAINRDLNRVGLLECSVCRQMRDDVCAGYCDDCYDKRFVRKQSKKERRERKEKEAKGASAAPAGGEKKTTIVLPESTAGERAAAVLRAHDYAPGRDKALKDWEESVRRQDERMRTAAEDAEVVHAEE